MRANKLRATLTMLGVIIGSACIVLVVTVALTGRRYIGSQIEAVGSNIVYAWLEQSNTSQNVSLADQISVSDLDAIREGVPDVVQVAGTNDIPMNVIADRQSPAGEADRRHARLSADSQADHFARPLFRRRRFLHGQQGVRDFRASGAGRAVPTNNPVGQAIHVGELSFTVIGIFRERVATFGQSEIRTIPCSCLFR